MKQIYPDLWLLQSGEEAGFAYLLKRKDGNILMGRSSDISAQIPLLEERAR